MLENIRPFQRHAPAWPWRNEVRGEQRVVVDREPDARMPDLVEPFLWYCPWEAQDVHGLPWHGECTRDMKSVFTTALRLRGYEALYGDLMAGKNTFAHVVDAFITWQEKFFAHLRCNRFAPDPLVYLIGDDIAWRDNTFFPPDMLRAWLFPEYARMISHARQHARAADTALHVVYHSDGALEGVFNDLLYIGADEWLVQLSLNPSLAQHTHVHDHSDPSMTWQSYPVREDDLSETDE